MAVTDFIYSVARECPVCNTKIQITKVRNKLTNTKQDMDFCMYYKELNPYYYVVAVCPFCGYAANEVNFMDISAKDAEKIRNIVKDVSCSIDYSGERTIAQGIAALKLALHYSNELNHLPSRKAGLYLRLAWLYRELGDVEFENVAMQEALYNYELALAKEDFPIGNMSDTATEYLVAILKINTGNKEGGRVSLSKLIASHKAKQEKRIYELAQNVWNELKEQSKEEEVKAKKTSSK